MDALLIIFILFLPLLGGIIAFFFDKNSPLSSTLSVIISLIITLYLVFAKVNYTCYFEWLPGLKLSIIVDSVSIVLILLVTLISALVHIFSKEYMKEDKGKSRYFAKLGFFTFSMIGLLIANHLFLLFIFWELVGLASYLLIGFWYINEGVPSSARLAFMVNRIADLVLLAGILILNTYSTLTISDFDGTWLFVPSLLIAIGAFGKSAQLPFSGWLTKAMVGPTPVSALIHAATMVAAGVYLLYRVAPFLNPQVLIIVALVGTFTSLYGGLCALFQYDIKKILAYSTISQLGYMVMGIGVGNEEASIFHLFTHAFFKAGLFLGAGSIIHFMRQIKNPDAQDIRSFGGLKSTLPWTYKTFLICSLALVGIPLFSGFMSKEGIIIACWEWAERLGIWAYIVPDIALIVVFLTAMYVGRMVFLVFWGESRLTKNINQFIETIHIKFPLVVLALGSFWLFYNWNPLAHTSWLLNLPGMTYNDESSSISQMVMLLSLLMAIVGLAIAYALFKSGSSCNKNYATLNQKRIGILNNGFYLVSMYQTFGKGIERISNYTFMIDHIILDGIIHFIGVGTVVLSKIIALIDHFLVDGIINVIVYLSDLAGRLLASLSSRDSQVQLTWLFIGLILILSGVLFF